MSQYAFYLQKKKSNPETRFIFDRKSMFNHNGYELENVFGITEKNNSTDFLLFLLFRILRVRKFSFLTTPIRKVLGFFNITLVKENHNYDYDESLLKKSKGLTFYYGGWHSEKYFKSNENEVRASFKFREVSTEIKEIANKIENTNSVSIHVRRGDFMNAENWSIFGSVCTIDYFKEAINKMNNLLENPHYFIFSNDIDWVKQNLSFENFTIIDCNKGKNSWIDMMLMSKCKHNINSNSTFSWWGSWLNKNEDKNIIVPHYFMNNLITKDFYPSSWTKLKDY